MAKTTQQKKNTLKNKADKLFQEIGRLSYNKCLICGGEYSTLHHFILKSQSYALRYELLNAIPICSVCHCSIHTGRNDMVVGKIIKILGIEWFNKLEEAKKNRVPDTLEYIKEVVENLQSVVDKLKEKQK